MNTKHLMGVAAVLAVMSLMIAACGGSPTAAPSTPTPAPLNITLQAQDIKFDVTTLTARVNQQINVTYVNTGALEHTFLIDGLVPEKKIASGQTLNFSFTPTAAGTYTYYCNVAGHKEAGMMGTLTVTP